MKFIYDVRSSSKRSYRPPQLTFSKFYSMRNFEIGILLCSSGPCSKDQSMVMTCTDNHNIIFQHPPSLSLFLFLSFSQICQLFHSLSFISFVLCRFFLDHVRKFVRCKIYFHASRFFPSIFSSPQINKQTKQIRRLVAS